MCPNDAPLIVSEIPGPRARAILERQSQHLAYQLPTPTPVVWDRAEGAIVTDVDGNRYVDFSSGVLVMNTGHSHPHVIERIQTQVTRVVHSYFAPTEAQVEGLEALASLLPPNLSRILPVTTGAEAVEAAVKIARAFTGKTEIISFLGAFHGRTYLTMAIGGISGIKRGFGPLPAGHLHAPYAYCYRCPFGLEPGTCAMRCLYYLEELLLTASRGDPAAVVVEPYLGSAGSVVPPPEFLEGLRGFCDRHGILLILDEVQSGFGRTGKTFAFEHTNFIPDIMCLGKGMASGVPTSAVVIRNDIAEALKHLSWTSTFAANPLSGAAVAASVEVLVKERLAEKAQRTGEFMMRRLRAMQAMYPIIGDVRGIGLAIGVEFVRNHDTKEPAKAETARALSGRNDPRPYPHSARRTLRQCAAHRAATRHLGGAGCARPGRFRGCCQGSLLDIQEVKGWTFAEDSFTRLPSTAICLR